MEQRMQKRLALLKQKASSVKKDTQLRHVPDRHDLMKCTENTQLMRQPQEKAITMIK